MFYKRIEDVNHATNISLAWANLPLFISSVWLTGISVFAMAINDHTSLLLSVCFCQFIPLRLIV